MYHGRLAQLARASPLQGECQGFESLIAHHIYALVAQLVEHSAFNRLVEGSNPSEGTIFFERYDTMIRQLMILSLATLFSCGGQSITEIENVGSDTLLEVAGSFAEHYSQLEPTVAVSVSGGGSGVGVAALLANDCEIANCSRPLKDKELKQAEKNGVTPVQHIVGYDGIAVFVHKDSPVDVLTMAQLKAIFGEGGNIETWEHLGFNLGGDKENMIQIGSRQNNSGTYECFREKVLGKKGRFKQRCNNLNGSKDVVEFCAASKSAIGYSGLAYKTDDVKVVRIAALPGEQGIEPTVQTVQLATYPISRPLYMYTNGNPTGAVGKYLEWIKSYDGQMILANKGYVPLRLTQ